ncbi:2-oxoglutarate and iron-dependent oxygenase domain-containing protein 2-like isoform X1 [Pollicipes pollicipes]|uniref:2-oxoglutarate and iron-dependent oxygenase domain-containing protein 2-like isoform X1 n=1 Tax=Pollicipes pollicipes TaxID=41117 RepID=UPI0018857052|nr:2-oxoglutarate and iron-dependent oxygenase domain-containing protein 2-like isoform X1 [Pollicipes pollicipes]
MRTVFGICKCFYTENIYLKEFNLHVTYLNKAQFLKEYSPVLKKLGCNCPKHMPVQIEEEVNRRKQLQGDAAARHKYILQQYVPRNPLVYKLQPYFLHPKLLELVQLARTADVTAEQLTTRVKSLPGRIYAFPVFTQEFCRQFLEELHLFEESDMPKGRPNTMNNHGILLDELGMNQEFFDVLREEYIQPITALLYPELGGESLDSHKVFVVKYKQGEDEDLGCHFDNAELSMNVSLNDGYESGELYFSHMAEEPATEDRLIYQHQMGVGALHRGQHLHGAMPIEDGERYNLILWLRSSRVRNQRCPMCRRRPAIVPVSYGTGDGFVQYTEDVCATS